MKLLNDKKLLFVRNLKKTLREPLWLFLGLMQPALYILLYMPLLKNIGSSDIPLSQVAQIFVPGMLVIMGVSGLFTGLGFIPEIREGYITLLLVTPVSRVAILLGLVFNYLVTLSLQATVLIGIALLLGLRTSVWAVIFALILVMMVGSAMACFSYVISITPKTKMDLPLW